MPGGGQAQISRDPESESDVEQGPPCQAERVAYREGGNLKVVCSRRVAPSVSRAQLLVEDQQSSDTSGLELEEGFAMVPVCAAHVVA